MVALPLALNGLPRGVLDLGDLWGSGAAKLGVDHLSFPPELANGIRDHLLFRHLLYYVVVGNDAVVAHGVVVFHDGLEVLSRKTNLVSCVLPQDGHTVCRVSAAVAAAAGFVEVASPFVVVVFALRGVSLPPLLAVAAASLTALSMASSSLLSSLLLATSSSRQRRQLGGER